MRRGEVRYANLDPPFGRRPVLVVTATTLIEALSAVTCAPVTTSVRDIATRVRLGPREGLRETSDAACDALLTIPKRDVDPSPIGSLHPGRFGELDRAIARALDIRRAHLPLA